MPLQTITFNGKIYPALQSEGNAMRWATPFAKEICKGFGFDVGCNRMEWCLENAQPADPLVKPYYDALNLPSLITLFKEGKPKEEITELDYIASSHCLEHLPDYVAALDYWNTKLKPGGVLFLYLPNCDYQQYWNPASNRKHLHYLNPTIMQSYFDLRTDIWGKVSVTQGYDLNGSFYAIAERI